MMDQTSTLITSVKEALKEMDTEGKVPAASKLQSTIYPMFQEPRFPLQTEVRLQSASTPNVCCPMPDAKPEHLNCTPHQLLNRDL